MSNFRHPTGNVFYRRINEDHPLIVKAEGVYLYDEDGKRYLDGSGGALVVNAGHGIDSIAQAIYDQIAKGAYIHATMFTSEVIEKYCQALSEIVPIEDPKFYPLTSGSEAIEAALKFSCQIQAVKGHPSRHLVISRWMSYHGATLGALAVTGKQKMRTLFAPMFKDMPHIPPPYCYRCPFGLEPSSCDLECASALELEILKHGEDRIAAFLAEPVSGATLGAAVPPAGYWPKIKEICDTYGLLLISDEVMTGMGRTGRWFGMEHWNIQPDIITIGKGSASGYFPLSILVVKGDLVDQVAAAGDFNHGGTYSHHAVGAAAGQATLDYLIEHQLVHRAEIQGNYLEKKLRAEIGNLSNVGDVRGIGLMWGIEFVRDKKSKAPFESRLHLSQQIADEAMRRGLIVYPGSGTVDGTAGDHIMLGPPLSISESEIDEMIEIFKMSIFEIIKSINPDK